MDTTSKVLIGAGALLALLLGVVVYATLSAGASPGLTATVVVARAEIAPYTLFTAANVDQLLTTRQVSADAVPTGGLTQPAQAVARITVIRLVPGEILLNTPDRLTTGTGEEARPSAAIPQGKVALTLPASDTLTVAGALRPGDRVDVILTWTPPGESAITRALYQGVSVFTVGPWQGRAGAGSGILGGRPAAPQVNSSVTLLLDYAQAVGLQYVQQTGGDVALALRRLEQGEDVPTAPITAARMRQELLGASDAVANP